MAVIGIEPVLGTPGFVAGPTASYAQIFGRPYQTGDFLPGGGFIASFAQDIFNTGSTNTLRPGLLMGQVNTGTYNKMWAPSVIDVTQGALANTGTSITLTPTGAAGLVQRIGTSGNLTLSGGSVAGGTARSATVAFSAVNTSTGVVTITNPAVAAVQTLNFYNSPSGTFALSIFDNNGLKQVTAQITYSGTAATLVTNIQNAINAVIPQVASVNQIVVSGTAVTAIALTWSGVNYIGLSVPAPIGITTDSLSAGNVSITQNNTGTNGAFIAGSIVGATDGSQFPASVIPDGSGSLMAGPTSGQNIWWSQIAIEQLIISQNILPYWPSDAGLQNWIKSTMNTIPSNTNFQFQDYWTTAV